jgi:hypothetical protein
MAHASKPNVAMFAGVMNHAPTMGGCRVGAGARFIAPVCERGVTCSRHGVDDSNRRLDVFGRRLQTSRKDSDAPDMQDTQDTQREPSEALQPEAATPRAINNTQAQAE